MESLLTKREACELLQISRTTLERLIAEGQIEAFRVGRLIRIEREEIRRYLSRNRCAAAAPKAAPKPAVEKRGPGRPKGSAKRQPEVYIPGMRVV